MTIGCYTLYIKLNILKNIFCFDCTAAILSQYKVLGRMSIQDEIKFLVRNSVNVSAKPSDMLLTHAFHCLICEGKSSKQDIIVTRDLTTYQYMYVDLFNSA